MYNSDSPSKGKDDVFYEVKKYILMLNEKYKKDQSKITWLSIRLPVNATSVNLDPMLQIAVTDLCAKKFSSESLILLIETGTRLKVDYLNRVRIARTLTYVNSDLDLTSRFLPGSHEHHQSLSNIQPDSVHRIPSGHHLHERSASRRSGCQ